MSRPSPTTSIAVACLASTVGLACLYQAYLASPQHSKQHSSSDDNDAETSDRHNQTRLIKGVPSLALLKSLTVKATWLSDYPLASDITKRIPIYDCSSLDISDPRMASALQDEWYRVLVHGPGVLVLKHMYPSHAVLDSANEAFARIIADEKASSHGSKKGDHFAPASANDRIWNSFSKHCLQDSGSFVQYYSNPFLALMCEAYLGPAYQITTQVNIVKPGGKPQVCHRDYHLGFQTAEDAAKWPRAVHTTSQMLTLQGAVAHTDMPLESGPTRLLPYSQRMREGYLAYRRPEFNEYFVRHHVSVALEKGDGLFFSPALFHAAGENTTTDIERSANLMQVSSAFGRPMETIDTIPLVEKSWPSLTTKYDSEGMSKEVEAVVASIAEGYSFPTNLDRRPPAPGGMAPESQQELVVRHLKAKSSVEEVVEQLKQMREDSKA